jgi:hypothetical protein
MFHCRLASALKGLGSSTLVGASEGEERCSSCDAALLTLGGQRPVDSSSAQTGQQHSRKRSGLGY